jgi:hypothetical protein
MDGTIIVQGRELSQDDIKEINDFIKSKPEWTSWKLSIELSERWNWRTLTGQLKDMACRSMLDKLHGKGLIVLPPKRKKKKNGSPQINNTQTVFDFPFDFPEPIHARLDELTPLGVTVVTARSPDGRLLHQLLSSHHYLGFRTNVGETIGYLIRDRHGRVVACTVFGAAAWKTAPRDAFIGWDAALRATRLSRIANNNRYLILPWVQVPHLASHVLGLLARRIRNDWMAKYGHPVSLLETFVDRSRFHGTCYRAANWQCVGQTKGRSRQDQFKNMSVPVKDIYLYPLTRNFRQELKA